MFTIRFSKKNHDAVSYNSNLMYIFKQQYCRLCLCRFVLHASIGLTYNFIVLDSVTKICAYVYNSDGKLIILSLDLQPIIDNYLSMCIVIVLGSVKMCKPWLILLSWNSNDDLIFILFLNTSVASNKYFSTRDWLGLLIVLPVATHGHEPSHEIISLYLEDISVIEDKPASIAKISFDIRPTVSC